MTGQNPSPAPEFLNRELSWLAFNAGVLEQAERPDTPLLNRLHFLTIVSSNLDEFVMVRVGGLRQLVAAGVTRPCPAGLSPARQLDQVAEAMRQMVERQYRCFNEQVVPAMAEAGLRRLVPGQLTPDQRRYLAGEFEERIYPMLTPVGVAAGREFSHLAPLLINVLVRLRPPDGEKGADQIAIVPIPGSLSRAIMVPGEGGHCFILVEDVVLMFLDRLFAGCEVLETALMRITRNADMSVEDRRDEDFNANFVAAMTDVLVQRGKSPVVRVELARPAYAWADRFCRDFFAAGDEQMFTIPGPLDLKGFESIAFLPGLANLRYPRWQAQPSPDLPAEADLWQTIGRQDVLLHHPYESFDAVLRLLNEAAADRNVLAIKQVLYRTSRQSAVIDALERAARAGKQVAVLVELKARFDEARNIEGARRLEQAGAQVVYGLAGLKVHAKALMIVRRDGDRIRRYVHLATGNYNELTARLYTDFGLITCDEDFGADVAAFFNLVTGYSQPADWRRIVVAPIGLRQRLCHLIDREIERAGAGRDALIQAKLNSLVDPELIRALYKASAAGVKVRLNVRGICCLRPGVAGLSENIEVVSIIDRFLEHSRIFYFRNGGEEEVYLASADWMGRNLDRRVEIMFPVLDERLRSRLIEALQVFLSDNVNGRRLGPDGTYAARAAGGGRRVRAQEFFMQSAEQAAARLRDATPADFRPIKPQDRDSRR